VLRKRPPEDQLNPEIEPPDPQPSEQDLVLARINFAQACSKLTQLQQKIIRQITEGLCTKEEAANILGVTMNQVYDSIRALRREMRGAPDKGKGKKQSA
jgi:DNA-directed RNA polymerase specialized sigma24 family protein